jgi:hypothetical protein
MQAEIVQMAELMVVMHGQKKSLGKGRRKARIEELERQVRDLKRIILEQ